LYSGYKAELFLLRPGDVYRAQALERRLLVDLGSPIGEVWVHSPEDLILYKLRCFRISHQPKHVRDIASIMLTLGDELKLDYIRVDFQEMTKRLPDRSGRRFPCELPYPYSYSSIHTFHGAGTSPLATR
jgi:hypothetical protein